MSTFINWLNNLFSKEPVIGSSISIPTDLTPYLPIDQARQISPNPWTETNGCTVFATTHACEIFEILLTGQKVNFLEQALYQAVYPKAMKDSQGNVTGFHLADVFNALGQVGLVDQSLLAEPVDFTFPQYVAPIDPSIATTGKKWLAQRSFKQVALNPAQAKNFLGKGVVLITIDLNKGMDNIQDLHEVVLINSHQYFDSYSTLVKELEFPIVAANLLTINRKTMDLVNDNGTWYLVGDLGKIGIADEADLARFQKVTSQSQNASTAGLPQVAVIKQSAVIVDQ